MITLVLSVALALGAPARESSAAAAHYTIDAGRSRLMARVRSGGLFGVFGHDHAVLLRDFAGEVEWTPGGGEPARLGLTIKAGSAAEIGKEFSEKDRREIDRAVREQALETARHPEIVFKSTKITTARTAEGRHRASITGQLTLHGVTRTVVIPAQVTLEGETLTARGEFPLRHSEYDIKRLSAAGGTVKAKDEMTLSFDVVAHKR